MASFFSVIVDGLDALFDQPKQQGFKAEFGSETDIASSFNKGFLISKNRKLTRRKSFENLLISGPTGSGKTTRLLLKTLYELKNCSLVVNDPSKELYLLSSGYLTKYFDIQTLNFSDSKISSGYNILSRIQKPTDIHKIAHMLVASTLEKGSNGDPFWSLQTKNLLSIFIRLVQFQDVEFRTMANVLYILNVFAVKHKVVDGWILETKDKNLILEYKAVITTPEKTLQNITATCKAALQLFSDPEIAKVTSCDSIIFSALRQKPTIIFLHNSISNMKYTSTLNAIFFEQLYHHILENLPHKNELDLFIMLEEASSLYIPILSTAIANTRKHRVGNIICVQSPAQLEHFYYKDAQNITANCVSKIFLPGISSLEILRELETLGGKTNYIDEKGHEKTKSLITIDEIRLLEENRTLILSGNNRFILGRTSPYYRSFTYKRRSRIPPLPLKSDIQNTPIRLLGDTHEASK
ncbi:MAG: type IV secretory system conjugative DNA transfer family protein [Bacteroidia bacterium]